MPGGGAVRIAGAEQCQAKPIVHYCIIGSPRNCLTMKRQRLFEAQQFGQHITQVAERLRPIRLQPKSSTVGRLGLGKAMLAG